MSLVCVCMFHSVDAVEMQFGNVNMSEHGVTIRREGNKNAWTKSGGTIPFFPEI